MTARQALVLVAAACLVLATAPPAASSGKLGAGRYGTLPLAFEPNRGQTDQRVDFVARGQGYAIFLTRSGAALSRRGRSSASFR